MASVRSRATTPLRNSSRPASLKFMPARLRDEGIALKSRSAAQGTENQCSRRRSDELRANLKEVYRLVGVSKGERAPICRSSP